MQREESGGQQGQSYGRQLDRERDRGRKEGHHEFLTALQLVTDGQFFEDESRNHVLIISETDEDSSQVGSAQKAEFKFNQQREPSVTWKDTEPSIRRLQKATSSLHPQRMPVPLEPQGRGNTHLPSKLRVHHGHLFYISKRLSLIFQKQGNNVLDQFLSNFVFHITSLEANLPLTLYILGLEITSFLLPK